MPKRWFRPLWLLLAVLFLAEAWLWDRLTEAGRWLRDRLPFEAFRRWAEARIAGLPPSGALLLFVIPVLVVQPIKLLTLWLIVRGHLLLGGLGFVAIKIVGFGAIAFLFDLTREKLLTIRWFAWAYQRVLWLRELAGAFIAPYRQAVREAVAALKARALGLLGRRRSGPSRLARIRARMRAR